MLGGRHGLLLVAAFLGVAVGCSSGSSGGVRIRSTTTVATTSTTPAATTPRPVPRTLPGTALKGEVAFLGAIHTVPVGALTMAFRQFGSGPDLLLIAGQASPMSVWPVSALAWLARSHRVTIYDNRDLGDTTTTKAAFALTDLADDAAGLISALGLHRPAVFGWSTGGEIGLLLAEHHPSALSSLAITGATPGGAKSVLPPPDIIDLLATPNPDLDKLFDVLFSPAGTEARNRFVSEILKVPQPAVSAHAAEQYDAAERDFWAKPEPRLDAISVPVLVMNGAGDYAVPSENARYIAMRIGKRARLALDAGGRHGWFIEHPRHFEALMTQFLG
jgi:pimeloyl-ACP methyl ester carboxylesterase